MAKKLIRKAASKKKTLKKKAPSLENLFRVKELMKQKNIGREELALYCGVTVASISSISTGKNTPSFKVLLLIAEKLEVDVRDLFHSTKPTSVTESELGEAKELMVKALKLLNGINKED